MTQLYVGNLSAEGDEKAIRLLFGKYGPVREVLMKNGYAFVEFESPVSAEDAMRDLNGSDILGHPMIVEPSHQQRLSSRRKIQHGKVEVSDIPHHINMSMIQVIMQKMGNVLKMEIDEYESRTIVTFETQEQAQRAAAELGTGHEHMPRVVYLDPGMNGLRTGIVTRKSSPGIPSSPSKNNSDFPLRILVPSDMVGAIIGKDGATIRMITQITKARVDVHRRENLGTAEKAITTIGPPECCTEACYQIMKIMQNELLMTNGMIDNGKYHEPLPVVPLKILAHNELVGRVIGKGGGTLKRIMAESGTKITISKLKDLTAFNMERTITILGTIDNCKKAESLISAKLRASYESDMAQFLPGNDQSGFGSTLSPSPTNIPPPNPPSMGTQAGMGPGRITTVANGDFLPSRIPSAGAQSLPATPSSTNVRTFTDYSGEHTRLTTLHGSTGALEVNNLGGFTTSIANGNKLASALESSIDGIVRTTTTVSGPMNGMAPIGEFNPGLNSHMGVVSRNGSGVDHLGLGMGHGPMHNKSATINNGMPSGIPVHILTSANSTTGMGNGNGISAQFHSSMLQTQHSQPVEVGENEVDDMADVFTGLSFKEPSLGAAPGYGRSRPRRSSAPVGNGDQGPFGSVGSGQNGYGLWGNSGAGNGGGESEFPIGSGNDGMPMPAMNQVGREYGLMPPISRNSPIPQQQQQQQQQQSQQQHHVLQQHHHQQQHHHHHNSQFPSTSGNVGGASGSLSAGIGPHASFKTAWTTVNPPAQGGNPPHLRLPLGVPGMGGAPGNVDGSSGGVVSQHGTQSIWSQGSFHSNTGIGMSSTVPSSSLPSSNNNNSVPAPPVNGSMGSKPASSNGINLPSTTMSSSNNTNSGSQPSGNPSVVNTNTSRPSSQTGSYSGSESSLSGISPIYSPTNNTSGFSGFSSNGSNMGNGNQPTTTSDNYPPSTLGLGLFPAGQLGMLSGGAPGNGEERESRSPFRASVPTPLTTVAETVSSNGTNRCEEEDFYPPSFVNDLLGETTQPSSTCIPVQW